jgi:hypothetical protein
MGGGAGYQERALGGWEGGGVKQLQGEEGRSSTHSRLIHDRPATTRTALPLPVQGEAAQVIRPQAAGTGP